MNINYISKNGVANECAPDGEESVREMHEARIDLFLLTTAPSFVDGRCLLLPVADFILDGGTQWKQQRLLQMVRNPSYKTIETHHAFLFYGLSELGILTGHPAQPVGVDTMNLVVKEWLTA